MLTGEGLKKAVEFFQLAISKDSSYASAYAGMADAYGLLAFFAYLPTNETLRKGEEAANKALQLDNTIAEAHASLGLVSLFDWKWPVAERELRRAIGHGKSGCSTGMSSCGRELTEEASGCIAGGKRLTVTASGGA